MKKSIKICIVFLILMLLIISNSYAASEACKVSMSSNKEGTLNIGDEVEISITLSNITLTGGITKIGAELSYDQNIFDIVYEEDSSIADNLDLSEFGSENLKVVHYQEGGWYLATSEVEGSNGAALIGENTGDPTIATGVIGKIKLKVKNTVTTTTTDIKLKTITVFGADESENTISSEASTNLKINAVSNKTTNTTKKNNTNGQNTTANTSTPYTGVEEVAPIIIAVAIIAIVAFVKLIKYKDIK